MMIRRSVTSNLVFVILGELGDEPIEASLVTIEPRLGTNTSHCILGFRREALRN